MTRYTPVAHYTAILKAWDIKVQFELPFPPCEHKHGNCSANGLYGGTCMQYVRTKMEGLSTHGIEAPVLDVRAVIENARGEWLDQATYVTEQLPGIWRVQDVAGPDFAIEARWHKANSELYKVTGYSKRIVWDTGLVASALDETCPGNEVSADDWNNAIEALAEEHYSVMVNLADILRQCPAYRDGQENASAHIMRMCIEVRKRLHSHDSDVWMLI